MRELIPVPYKLERNLPESFLYVKQHKVRGIDDKKPTDRTLFVVNVPPCVDESSLMLFFSHCGVVESVSLHSKPAVEKPEESRSEFFNRRGSCGFKVGYVVFDKAACLRKALCLNESEKSLIMFTGEQKVPPLRQTFCKEYNRRIQDPELLKKEVQDFMNDYDKKVQLEKEKAKEMDGVPNEEGWVTVTRHGKNPVTPRTEATNEKIRAKDKKKQSEKTLRNFYSCQIKESKMEHLAKLRKSFLEDKAKIALMRAGRKFKPY